MDSKKIAKDFGLPGCCGVTHLHKINPKVTKRAFITWLRDTHQRVCLGGLVTAVSKPEDTTLQAKLQEFGFEVLTKTRGEWLWFRRIKFSC